MASPSFRIDRTASIILDTSAAINLNASGHAPVIVEALPCAIAVTDVLIAELKEGRSRGRTDLDAIERFIAAGLIDIVGLDERGDAYFEGLVIGPTAETLDDGEAATIACSVAVNAIAVIDERKATNLSARRFPDLRVLTSLDLMLQPDVVEALGQAGLRDAVLGALRIGRMGVPARFEDWVVALIGADDAAACPSLPARLRARSTGAV